MSIETRVRILSVYAVVSLLTFLYVVATPLRSQGPAMFDEIHVRRINVVQEDGTLGMAITNRARWPDGIHDGRTFPRGDGEGKTGIVFYNDEGDESGALAWGGRQDDGRVEAGATLNFDQYGQDRTLMLQYGDDNGQRNVGLTVFDRPDIGLSTVIDRMEELQSLPDGPDKTAAVTELSNTARDRQRVFLGKDADRTAQLVLSDSEGHPRLVLSVDVGGSPRLTFLGEDGNVVESLPTNP